jgi:hypothetical protein
VRERERERERSCQRVMMGGERERARESERERELAAVSNEAALILPGIVVSRLSKLGWQAD